MSSEEGKEQAGQQEPLDDPLAAAEAAAEAEAEARETGAEKKERRFWPAALALMLLVLAGGGYYALTGLNGTARKLGGGSDFDRLASNSDIYDGSAGPAARPGDSFPLDEEAARREAYRPGYEARQDRMNKALFRGKGELAADAGAPGGAQDVPQALQDVHRTADQAPAAPEDRPQAAMAEKLKARLPFGHGPSGFTRSKGQAFPAGVTAFEGAGALAGKASLQRETAKASPRQGGKAGVLDSLKGAFRATFYGARIASQDSARSWISRAFDASAEADTAIEYDEKMKAKLDRVNPDSIPHFLRDQDVDAAEAKRLAVNDPGKPQLDKDGTYEALQKDKGYQQKKLASDFGSSMLNSVFAGISGTGSDQGVDPGVFSDPGDQQTLDSLALGDYLQSSGNGEECGCTAAAPCCCLPQNYFSQLQSNCPAYGPFQPDDPCGAAINGGGAGVTSGASVTP